MSGDLDLDAVFGRSSPDDAFAAVLTEARMVLAEIASPLEAELWGSDILAALGGMRSPAAQAIVPAAERSGSPEALAILRVLSALGWPELRAEAAAAASRLAAKDVPDPAWAAGLGAPEVRECWRYGDDQGLQEAVTLSFEYPAGRHVVSLLLDHSFGGGIKNVWVGEDSDVLARTEAMAAADPRMTFEMITAADARRRAERAIAAGSARASRTSSAAWPRPGPSCGLASRCWPTPRDWASNSRALLLILNASTCILFLDESGALRVKRRMR